MTGGPGADPGRAYFNFPIAEYLVEEYNFTGDKESLLEAKSLYEELLRKNPNHAGYIKHLAEVNQSLKN